MKIAALLFTIALGFFSFGLTRAPAQALQWHTAPGYSQCVRVFDGGTQRNQQRAIRFYNGCPERVFINACVVSTRGEVKLYRSGSRIQTNGNFTIYTFPFVQPGSVKFAASTSDPGIPPPCTIRS